MHALQVLPVLSFYIFRNTRITIIISILYGLLALYTLVQALKGKAFLKKDNIHERVIPKKG
jgi:hypothetical protein